jgi:hypothetical protein
MWRRYPIITVLLFVSLPMVAVAHDGIYMTLQTGWAGKSGLPSKSKVGARGLDRENIPVWRASVGYLHDFVPSFGVGFEAARGIYGKYVYHFANIRSATIRNATTEFLVVAELHQRALDYIGKLGGIRNTTNIHYVEGNSNETRIQPEVAFGLAYTFVPHFAVTGQYAHAFGEKLGTLAKPGWKSPSLNELLLGLRVTFY